PKLLFCAGESRFTPGFRKKSTGALRRYARLATLKWGHVGMQFVMRRVLDVGINQGRRAGCILKIEENFRRVETYPAQS
ncbi:MAG: hypothetical protein WCZ87_07055, partial [Thiohalobacteraceae bacterium]